MFKRFECWFFVAGIFILVGAVPLLGQQDGEEPSGSAGLETQSPRYQGKSLLGRDLIAAEPSSSLLEKYRQAKQQLEADPGNADLEIWLARFTAYQGLHRQAIQIYTNGLQRHPDDPRFLRHRGHRHISLRDFDSAIADLRRAAELVEGTSDQVEPDGMPNAQNQPVSSLHTNIWYHLGLAYYLKNDLPNAVASYERGLAASQNDDMKVAFTHWLYMCHRQMGQEKKAEQRLEIIRDDMHVIESFDYHQLCLFYKGNLTLEEIEKRKPAESKGSSDALRYGIANWYLYSGNEERSRQWMEEISNSQTWSSFGCIAAEATRQRNIGY